MQTESPQTVHTAPDLPEIIHRYTEGESLSSLAIEVGITPEGLRKRIKRWAYAYGGTEQAYLDLVEQVIVNGLVDAEEKVESAVDSVGVARTRETLKHAQWLAERRIPKKFAQKQEIHSDKTVTVIVHRETPQPVVVEGHAQIVGEVSTQDHSTPSE